MSGNVPESVQRGSKKDYDKNFAKINWGRGTDKEVPELQPQEGNSSGQESTGTTSLS